MPDSSLCPRLDGLHIYTHTHTHSCNLSQTGTYTICIQQAFGENPPVHKRQSGMICVLPNLYLQPTTQPEMYGVHTIFTSFMT